MSSKVIWDYINLDNKLSPSNVLERVSLYSTLFVQPIWNILYWITWLLVPWLFEYMGGSYDTDLLRSAMTLANTAHVAYSSVMKWGDVLRHYNLGTTILGWRLQTLRVPKIHVRSRDPRHQYFKYLAAATPLTPLPSLPKTSS
jgi:hypothetical protein